MKKVLMVVLIMFMTCSVYADSPVTISFFKAGTTSGSSDMDGESWNIGNANFIECGSILLNNDKGLILSFGLHSGKFEAGGIDVTTNKMVWEMGAITYLNESVRVGGGLTFHDMKIDLSDSYGNDITMESPIALGAFAMVDLMFKSDNSPFSFTIGLKYTVINYDWSYEQYSGELTGDSVAFVLGIQGGI